MGNINRANRTNKTIIGIILFAAVFASVALFSSLATAGEFKERLSAKDDDAFILYKYSLLDAGGDGASKISKRTEGNKTTLKYDGHSLSCRTVMTGSITQTANEGKTHVVGDFEVANNSYGITQLSFDFYDEGKRTRTGTMTVDNKVIDMKRFDRR